MAYRIPDNASAYLDGEAVNRDNLLFHLGSADRKFGEAATRSIVSVAMATHVNLRRTHHQQLSPFRDGMDLFLCGGGAKLQFFQQLIDDVEEQLRGYLSWDQRVGIRVQRLPLPANLIAQGLAPDEYDRIAVAFGLSFPAMDLPEIRVADLKTEVEQAKRSGVAINAAQLDQIVRDLYYPPPPPQDKWREVKLRRPLSLGRVMAADVFEHVNESLLRKRFESRVGHPLSMNDILPDSVIIEELAVNHWRPRFERE
jgi:hypothetical protein